MDQATQLKGIEINNAKLFQKRAKLLSNTGGIISSKNYNAIFFTTIRNMLFAREYTFADILKTGKGIEFCQNAFLPEMNTLNLFERIKNIEVPVHFFQGVKDAVAPYGLQSENELTV
jgi:pimeloyl-ACP methyl ester carboxylesterase